MSAPPAAHPGPAPAAVSQAVERATAVNTALNAVFDPELDRPITELGFVRAVSIGAGGAVEVRLRLPTYFCAPNFAWLMVEDARRVLAALPWTGDCTVVLEDHFASEEINRGAARGQGFEETFPRLADTGRLEELRAVFLRKGHLAVQSRLGRRLLERGWTFQQLSDAALGDLPERLTVTLRRRRTALGLPAGPDSALFTDGQGRRVPAGSLEEHLRRGRAAGVGIEANTEICEGLLHVRYDGREPADGTEAAPGSPRTGGERA